MLKTVFLASVIVVLFGSVQEIQAANCTVTNANDSGAGSLRACILGATVDGDIVTIAPEVVSPIFLITGALNIDAGISILGAGPGATVIDGSGNGNNRMFTFDASVTGKLAHISGVTIQGGNLNAEGSAILIDRNTLNLSNCMIQNNTAVGANGGAIMVAGAESTLNIDNCQVLNNHVEGANFNGGAIFSRGNLFINNSVFSQNFTAVGESGNGGAIYLDGGIGQILNSIFSQNVADADGGAVYNASTNDLLVNNSSFEGNSNRSGVGVGGAIYNHLEALVVTQSDFTLNTGGGAIFNDHHTIADNCYFSGNSSSNFDGGAIQNESHLILRNSTVIGNTVTTGRGGGIFSNGVALIENTTVANNSSDLDGGGIFVDPGSNFVTLDNVTIFGNQAAGRGGGLFSGETSFLNNLTIANNTAGGSGGGIYTDRELEFANSIIAGNSDNGQGPDCFYFAGLFIADGPNLIQNPTGCTFTGDVQGAILNQAPLFEAELTNNGGPGIGRSGANPTLTLGLQALSPALEAGENTSCRPTDQRGVTRPQGAVCDLGALEEGPTADLSATSLNFGEELVGFTTESQSVTLINNGSVELPINGVSVSGDAGDFAVDNGCVGSVPPGGSCQIAASFTPTTNTIRQASVTVDTGAGVRVIALLGAGTLDNGGGGGCAFRQDPQGNWHEILLFALGIISVLAYRFDLLHNIKRTGRK